MAYGITPTPGGAYLCLGKCEHLDCAATRKIIDSKCRHCKKKIGADRKWCQDEAGNPAHAVCVWKNTDKNRPTA